MTRPRRRPPEPQAALTPAERKRVQRARDLAALWADGVSFDGLTLSALVEQIPALIRDGRPGTLGLVLTEIGRRGGVVVAARPGTVAGRRIKS